MHWSWCRNFVAFAMLPLVACSSIYAQSNAAKVAKLKLEDYGWQPLPKEQRGERAGTRSQLVSIDHKGRVLVGFTSRDNYGLATREHPGLSFHILRFTPEGKVDLSRVLPTNNLFTNGLYLGPNDQIFARANDTLQWLSEEDETMKEAAAWRTLASCPRDCYIAHSFSRRTLIVRTGPTDHFTYAILDASSSPPQLVQNCPSFAFYAEIITDKFAYQSSDNISTDVRRWPFCDQEHGVELPLDMRGGMVRPLNDEALLLLGTGKDRRGVELVTSDGQVKFRKEMPKHDVVAHQVRSDERGDRFAFTVQTWHGGSSFLDIGGKVVAFRVVVYSETGQDLAAVSLNPQLANVSLNPYYYRTFGLSMSPDGHRLAILDESVVTVVDIQ